MDRLESTRLTYPPIGSRQDSTGNNHELGATNLLSNVVDVVDFGIIVADQSGLVVFLNRAAARLLNLPNTNTGDVSLAHLSDSQADPTQWGRFVDWSLNGGLGLFELAFAGARHVVAVSVTAEGHLVIRFERPCELSEPAQRYLGKQFGLTPAELNVVSGLLRGKSPRTIAKDKGVAESTVRTQIKHALSKTRTRGISDLILKITRYPSI